MNLQGMHIINFEKHNALSDPPKHMYIYIYNLLLREALDIRGNSGTKQHHLSGRRRILQDRLYLILYKENKVEMPIKMDS